MTSRALSTAPWAKAGAEAVVAIALAATDANSADRVNLDEDISISRIYFHARAPAWSRRRAMSLHLHDASARERPLTLRASDYNAKANFIREIRLIRVPNDDSTLDRACEATDLLHPCRARGKALASSRVDHAPLERARSMMQAAAAPEAQGGSMPEIPSREIRLAARPEGMPRPSDFALADAGAPEPGDGELQVRNTWMSVDPYMRGRMNDRKSYIAPFQLGATLEGGAIGEVVASNAEGFAPGDLVESMYGWREAWTASARGVRKLDPG
jgi:hypothetical protein